MTAKAQLLATLAGTNRGLLASASVQQAVLAAIAHLETQNPIPKPMAHLEQLDGNWRLLYTTSQQLLGFERLPLVRVGQIYQCIQATSLTLCNLIELDIAPALEAIVAVTASLTPVSEQRVEANFKGSVIGLKRLLKHQSLEALITQLGSEEALPALRLRFNEQRQAGWLDTTYLDADLRIGRGNRDSVFVLTKV